MFKALKFEFNLLTLSIAITSLIFLTYSFVQLPSNQYFELGQRQIGLIMLTFGIILNCYAQITKQINFFFLAAILYFLSSLVSPLVGMTLAAFCFISVRRMHGAEKKALYEQRKQEKAQKEQEEQEKTIK